jgi:cytochrome c peroxidase
MWSPQRRAALVLVLACAAGWEAGARAGEPPLAPVDDPGPRAIESSSAPAASLDGALRSALRAAGFTGDMERSLERRLGRRIDRRLADLGRLLWFDTVTGLHGDNACAGCHSPTHGFGDTQSIAIGIDNNGIVGPDRAGPRNQRRAPIAINTVFYPGLMWNSRFASLSGDPFDPSAGFRFPAPEGLTLSYLPHLLVAQAFIPPTERNEVAGFEFPGDNAAIRAEVLRRLNAVAEYRRLFGQVFPEIRAGGPITFDHFGRAIAEFEFTLAFTDAPLDRFARGEKGAMAPGQKRGALLFFGRAGCVSCHAVAGSSNEMFSDFRMHVIGVPQVAPAATNATFDGPRHDEDFGLEQVSGKPDDRYAFRTAPLRNLAVQPAYMHDGCFTTIEDAVRHHLDVFASARAYSPERLDADLRGPLGPIEPVLERVDPRLRQPIALSSQEFDDLVEFLRRGLLDPRADFDHLRHLIPSRVPSGRPTLIFEAPSGEARAAHPAAATAMATVPVAASGIPRPRLLPPRPNPSAGEVALRLELSEAGGVEAQVVDASGRVVRALECAAPTSAGPYALRWDGRDRAGRLVRPGVYFVRVRAGAALLRQTLVRVR